MTHNDRFSTYNPTQGGCVRHMGHAAVAIGLISRAKGQRMGITVKVIYDESDEHHLSAFTNLFASASSKTEELSDHLSVVKLDTASSDYRKQERSIRRNDIVLTFISRKFAASASALAEHIKTIQSLTNYHFAVLVEELDWDLHSEGGLISLKSEGAVLRHAVEEASNDACIKDEFTIPSDSWFQNRTKVIAGIEKKLRTPALPSSPSRAGRHVSSVGSDDDARKSAVVVWASGGMGKSAIVKQVLRRLRRASKCPEAFPDGVVVCELRMTPRDRAELSAQGEHGVPGKPIESHELVVEGYSDTILSYIIEKLGIQLKPTDKRREIAESELKNKRLLIVLDGVEDAHVVDSIREVLAGTSCGLIVTTEDRAVVRPGDYEVEIPVLNQRDGMAVLKYLAKRRARPDERKEVYDLVGGLPLALYLAGVSISADPEEVPGFLASLRAGLGALDIYARRGQSVNMMLRERIRGLQAQGAVDVLRILGALDFAMFRKSVIDEALPEISIDVGNVLRELKRYGLIRAVGKTGEKRYIASSLIIARYARENHPASREDVANLARYYSMSLESGSLDVHTALSEIGHIRRVLRECTRLKLHDVWIDLILASAVVYEADYAWNDALSQFTRGIDDRTLKLRIAVRKLKGRWLYRLGRLCWLTGDTESAERYLEHAKKLLERFGDLGADWFGCHVALGLSIKDQKDRSQESLDYLLAAVNNQTAVMAAAAEDKATAYLNIAGIFANMRKLNNAHQFVDAGMSLVRDVAARTTRETFRIKKLRGIEGRLIYQKAYLNLQNDGYSAEVMRLVEEALRLAVESGDRAFTAECLNFRAAGLQDQKRHAEAEREYVKALKIFESLSNSSRISWIEGNIGELYLAQGKHSESAFWLVRAIKTATETKINRLEGLWIGALGNLCLNMGLADRASACFGRAIEKLADSDRREDIEFEISFATLDFVRGEFARAEQRLSRIDKEAKRFDLELSYRFLRADVNRRLGNLREAHDQISILMNNLQNSDSPMLKGRADHLKMIIEGNEQDSAQLHRLRELADLEESEGHLAMAHVHRQEAGFDPQPVRKNLQMSIERQLDELDKLLDARQEA